MLDCMAERITALEELKIFQYCTKEEQDALINCTNENLADRLVRTYRERYWNKMIADYEKEEEEELSDEDEDAEENIIYTLSNRSKNALLRNKITTFSDFYEYLKRVGWENIRGLGYKGTREVLALKISENEINSLMKKYKSPAIRIGRWK